MFLGWHGGYTENVAKIYDDPGDRPERTKPLPPGLKPPVHRPPYQDPDPDPEDLDRFLAILREIKGKPPVRKDPPR
jgi:hypothetical protein